MSRHDERCAREDPRLADRPAAQGLVHRALPRSPSIARRSRSSVGSSRRRPVEGADDAERAAAESGRIRQFREDTRDARIRVARELEHAAGRKVAWGAVCGDTRELFTTISVPVMTRLRQPERQVLDTLVDAGVARSRSDALAWCVKLVGQHSEDWLAELREAMTHVEEVRTRGPQ